MSRYYKKSRNSNTDIFYRHGGKRKGAGRKPNGEKAGNPHLKRPKLHPKYPIHVTLKLRKEIYNLRSKRCFSKILRSIQKAQNRFGFRVIHYSVQGNHFHFLVEAAHRKSLSRGMQGLSVRIAKALNKVMERKGPVFADRYHARILRTPFEVRTAIAYVLKNAQHHGIDKNAPKGWMDPYSSSLYLWMKVSKKQKGNKTSTRRKWWIEDFYFLRQSINGREVSEPHTWLLSNGWLKGRRGPPLF